jgi:uncharacterized membrane protein
VRRPADSKLMVAILVFAIIGLIVAAYTTYEHYHGFKGLLCFGAHSGHSSCETVQSSTWSELDGIPVAVLGLVGYVTLLVSLFIRGELARAFGFLVALIGFGFSMYLTYREAFSIHQYCEWCLTSAACMTILMVLTGVRFLRSAPA